MPNDIVDFLESIITLANSARTELDSDEIRDTVELIQGDLDAILRILNERQDA